MTETKGGNNFHKEATTAVSDQPSLCGIKCFDLFVHGNQYFFHRLQGIFFKKVGRCFFV